ncbi:MAG: hypothetical protein WCG87_12400, partial [Bacteroidota bacterium]
MSLLHILSKVRAVIPFYRYLTKGAKVDAALNFISSSQKPLGASEQNPTDRPVHVSEAIFVFDFESHYELVLTNASGNPAYNLTLPNVDEIFSRHDPLPKNCILNPGESIKINCWFVSRNVQTTGSKTDQYHDIPAKKKKRILVIKYDN